MIGSCKNSHIISTIYRVYRDTNLRNNPKPVRTARSRIAGKFQEDTSRWVIGCNIIPLRRTNLIHKHRNAYEYKPKQDHIRSSKEIPEGKIQNNTLKKYGQYRYPKTDKDKYFLNSRSCFQIASDIDTRVSMETEKESGIVILNEYRNHLHQPQDYEVSLSLERGAYQSQEYDSNQAW